MTGAGIHPGRVAGSHKTHTIHSHTHTWGQAEPTCPLLMDAEEGGEHACCTKWVICNILSIVDVNHRWAVVCQMSCGLNWEGFIHSCLLHDPDKDLINHINANKNQAFLLHASSRPHSCWSHKLSHVSITETGFIKFENKKNFSFFPKILLTRFGADLRGKICRYGEIRAFQNLLFTTQSEKKQRHVWFSFFFCVSD